MLQRHNNSLSLRLEIHSRGKRLLIQIIFDPKKYVVEYLIPVVPSFHYCELECNSCLAKSCLMRTLCIIGMYVGTQVCCMYLYFEKDKLATLPPLLKKYDMVSGIKKIFRIILKYLQKLDIDRLCVILVICELATFKLQTLLRYF